MDNIINTPVGKQAPVWRDPVAIVGMACRFPQAASCEAFWELLKQGKDAVTEIQDTRWSAAAWYDPDPQAPNKTHHRHAAMLDGIEDFDPLFFGISPAEAAEMNPSQKLMLELVVWEAMESTHIPPAEFAGKKNRATVTPGDKMVMIFPGQGSQWLGMGRERFAQEAVFRKTIETCHEAFKPYTDWSLIEQLHAGEGISMLHEINVVQPILFAIQVSVAMLWMSWGIMPDAVVGHSMGEFSAAHVAGVLDLQQAARIICTRSKLMKRVTGKGGAMAVTELSRTQAESWIARYPQLSLAVSNSPKSSVMAGDQQSLNEVLVALEQQNLFARLVKVDVASHSPQMDSLKEDLFHALEDLQPRAATIPISRP